MMAKKNTKNSFGAIVFAFILCFVIGIGCGVVGKCYTVGGYEIPATIVSNSTTVAGDIDVDVVKSKDLSIHFIELGNKYTGDCTLIKVGDVEILVDAGSKASSVTPIFNYVSQYIENGLDYVIVTHAHEDHYAGFATGVNEESLLDKLNPQIVIHFARTNQKATSTLYKNFNRELDELKERNTSSQVYNVLECYNNTTGNTKAQRSIALSDDVNLNFLYQKYYEEKATTENNYSVCFELEQKASNPQNNKYYMFTGDLESVGESSLLENNTLHQVELYKAGHHGSKTSSSTAFMAQIQPKIVCVCCCAGSSEYTSTSANQFPTQDFIDRVAPYTTLVYVTTLCLNYNESSFTSFNGNIVITSNKNDTAITVQCSNNTTVLKDTDWFKNNRICPASWAS